MILRTSKSKWIDIADFEGVKFYIDYPTVQQAEELREIFFQIIFNNPNYSKRTDEPAVELTYEQKAKEKMLLGEIAKRNILYCVKNWEGIKDEAGEIIECKIVNNQIEKSLFESLISNMEYHHIIRIGDLIEDEVKFNDADKKK
jgi:hypothetical protein